MRACGRTTSGVLCQAGGCGCCEGRRPRWLAPGTTTSTRARHSLSLSRKHYSRRRAARVGRGWPPCLLAHSSPPDLRPRASPHDAPAASSTLIRVKRRPELFGFSHPTEETMRRQRCAGVEVEDGRPQRNSPPARPSPASRPPNVFLQHNTLHTSATLSLRNTQISASSQHPNQVMFPGPGV